MIVQPIEYGLPDTQCGVITESLPEGGVRLTIPMSAMKWGQRFLSGWSADGWLDWLIEMFRGRSQVRAIITLSVLGLSITEPSERGSIEFPALREYPLDALGEIRLNRYGPGVYVSVPGRDNFDLLANVNRHVTEYVAEVLEKTLKGLRERTMRPPA